MLAHGVQIARGEAEPEAIRDLTRHASQSEVVTRRLARVLGPEHVTEVRRGRGVELPEGFACVLLLRPRLDFPDLDAHAIGYEADGGWPLHAQPLLEKGEDVTSLVADEAVVDPLLGRDGEVAMCALMERTRAAEIRPRALEIHVLADDLHDVGGLAHTLDRLVADHAITRARQRSRRCRPHSTYRGETRERGHRT